MHRVRPKARLVGETALHPEEIEEYLTEKCANQVIDMSKTYDSKVWDLCMVFLEDEKDLTFDQREAQAHRMAPEVQALIEDLISEIPSAPCGDVSPSFKKCSRLKDHCGAHQDSSGETHWADAGGFGV